MKEKLGAWNVVHRRFLAPRTIHTWAVVIFYPVPESPLTRFLDTLCTNLNKLGKYEAASGCWKVLTNLSYTHRCRYVRPMEPCERTNALIPLLLAVQSRPVIEQGNAHQVARVRRLVSRLAEFTHCGTSL